MSFLKNHSKLEKNATLLLIASLAVVTVGGIVEIAPLFYLENTIEKVEGMRPYSPLELAGRDIYVREGCYLCHSQMICPFRDEVERYGHYSLAAESMYDHSFQWGSKRTGPDLARVGGRYSNEWHVQHLVRPRDVVPESVMPNYGFLLERPLNINTISANLKAILLLACLTARKWSTMHLPTLRHRQNLTPIQLLFSNAIPRRRLATLTAIRRSFRRWMH